MIDAKLRTTTYTFDARGRQLTTTTPDGKTVTKGYDPMGLVISMTDEENRITQYSYDAASPLKTVIDPLSQRTRYTYDASGNRLTRWTLITTPPPMCGIRSTAGLRASCPPGRPNRSLMTRSATLQLGCVVCSVYTLTVRSCSMSWPLAPARSRPRTVAPRRRTSG